MAQTALLVSFSNQDDSRRRYGIAAIESSQFHWLSLGKGHKDMGATGFAYHGGLLFIAVQSEEPRLVAYDPSNWSLAAVTRFAHVRDPHSMAVGSDGLHIASTGDNAIYRLVTKSGALQSEELVWRHPGASGDRDDVHLNSLAFVDDRILATGFGPRAAESGWLGDGFVIELPSGKRLAAGLSHPHSVCCDGDRVAVAESEAGRVQIGRLDDGAALFSESVELPGYPRGLAFDGDALLIGTSVRRKISRSRGEAVDHAKAGSGECAIWRYDLGSRTLARFLDCSGQAREIYDIGFLQGALPPASAAPRPKFGLFGARP